jgi:hypothetical protein
VHFERKILNAIAPKSHTTQNLRTCNLHSLIFVRKFRPKRIHKIDSCCVCIWKRKSNRVSCFAGLVYFCLIFVEQSSTIECYLQPPPKFGNKCKQASLLFKTNKYFHMKSNNTGYHIAQKLLCALEYTALISCARAASLFKKNIQLFLYKEKCYRLPHSSRACALHAQK